MKIRSFVPAAAALVVLGAAGCILPHAFAQPMWDQVKVHLPYSVNLGDKTIPPGDYLIKQLESAEGNSPVLLIYNKNGMHFETTALTVPIMDPNTPQKTDVTLHHVGDNYYFDKIWIAGKNYGYEIPLPSRVRERAMEAASVSVPTEPMNSNSEAAPAPETTGSSSTATTSTADESTPPPPPPPPVEEPAAAPAATPATEPAAQAAPAPEPAPQAAPAPSDEGSANRERQPTDSPDMPATSAGWLAMLLSGSTLSSAGLMLRRRKR